jgi:hypothetical protein
MTDPTARIEAALSHLGSEHEPPSGWEARVIAATTAPRRRPWWLFATSALAVAGAGAVLMFGQHPDHAPDVAFMVDAPWDKAGAVFRGPAANVGDLVHATARGGSGYRAVWVYHRDALVAACPGGAACQVTGDATIADVTLSAVGSYRIVALLSSVPVAPPRGTYDTDVASARSAGAADLEKSLIVR